MNTLLERTRSSEKMKYIGQLYKQYLDRETDLATIREVVMTCGHQHDTSRGAKICIRRIHRGYMRQWMALPVAVRHSDQAKMSPEVRQLLHLATTNTEVAEILSAMGVTGETV